MYINLPVCTAPLLVVYRGVHWGVHGGVHRVVHRGVHGGVDGGVYEGVVVVVEHVHVVSIHVILRLNHLFTTRNKKNTIF